MNELDVLEVGRDAIWVLIKVSAPIMLVALSVGLVISLIQALTQIQEMTLSFVPKILSIFACILLFMPYMLRTLIDFNEVLFQKMIGLP